MRPDMIKGHLETLILAALATGPAHGYRIIQDIHQRSGGVLDLQEGAVYPALHRLEEAKLITGEWTTSTGRRRRTYRISGTGRALLAQRAEEWRQFAAAMDTTLPALAVVGS